MDPADYVRCPYDPAHLILKARIQFHLMTDHPNYVGPKIEPCPFNSTHMIDVALMSDHKMTCPDRGIVDNFVVSVGRSTLPAGIAPVTNYNISYDDSDIWDDQGSSVSVLNQIKQKAEDKPILITSVGLSKAKKREHIIQERRRHQKLDAPQPSKPVPYQSATQQLSSSFPSSARANYSADKQSNANPQTPMAVQQSETPDHQSSPNSVLYYVKATSSEAVVPNNNEADFPSLGGNAGNRSHKRNVALSRLPTGTGVDFKQQAESEPAQTKPVTNAWAKPLERSAQEEISVPAGMGRGSWMGSSSHQGMSGRSVSNPWARGQGSMNRGTGSLFEIDPSSNDEFPSLSQASRGKRGM